MSYNIVRNRTIEVIDMFRDPVGYRVKTLNNLLKRNVDKHFGPQHDKATMMQAWIIGFVQMRKDQGEDTFQRDIEEEFSINRSTASEMLKLMSKRGMIERVPVSYDARLKKIVLTKKSQTFHDWINQTMKELHAQLVEGLSQEEINAFITITDKLIDNMVKSVK